MRLRGSLPAILLTALAVAVLPARSQQNRITIPLRPVEGFGPFFPFVHISVPGENGGVWQKAQAEVRGVPVDIHGFSIRYLNMQMDQFIYQSYREGLVDPGLGRSLIAGRSIDTAKLSVKHVDQDIPIVAGYDAQGNTVYVVDTKDDHSFWGKDRILVPPYNADAMTDAQMDSLDGLIDRPVALYEIFDGKKVHEMGATIRLWPYLRIPAADRQEFRGKIVFGISVYEHRRGRFTAGGRDWAVAVSNGFFSGVYGGAQDSFAIYPLRDTAKAGPVPGTRFVAGDRVAIGDSLFRIDEVSVDGSLLTLSVSKAAPGGEGINTGSRAPSFRGVSATGDTVTLQGQRGKYLLLVFWTPGSPAGEAVIPYINDVYRVWGNRNLSVIGVPVAAGPVTGGMIAERGIGWTQMPETDSARVLRDYSVLGYPSIYLIDPGGLIVANEGLKGYDLVGRVAVALGDSVPVTALAGSGNVEFNYPGAKDGEVAVAGDFTGWQPLPMYWSGNAFIRRMNVPAGRHLYRFRVNDEWGLDPVNDKTEKDTLGQVDNVIVVH